MGKSLTVSVAVIAGLAAIIIPIFASIYVANQQSLSQEIDKSRSFASDVLRRTEEAVDQANLGAERIARAFPDAPCSSGAISLMREIDLASNAIQAASGETLGLLRERSLLARTSACDDVAVSTTINLPGAEPKVSTSTTVL